MDDVRCSLTDATSNPFEARYIDFVTNGGNKIDRLAVGLNIEKLPIPEKSGYVFDGWYYDINLTNKVIDNDTFKVEEKKETIYNENGCAVVISLTRLYAKWLKVIEKDNILLVGTDENLLDVEQVVEEKIDNIELPKTGDEISKFQAYDVYLLNKSNLKVQPSGIIKLYIKIPKEYDLNKVHVYRVDGDTLISYDTFISGEYALIETDHFSTYVVAEVDNLVSKPEIVEPILLENKDNDVLPTENVVVENPDTGMFAFFVGSFVVIIMVIALIFMYLFSNKFYKI